MSQCLLMVPWTASDLLKCSLSNTEIPARTQFDAENHDVSIPSKHLAHLVNHMFLGRILRPKDKPSTAYGGGNVDWADKDNSSARFRPNLPRLAVRMT